MSNAGGLVGNGCVGEYHSPGTSPCGTGRSTNGQTAIRLPARRRTRHRRPAFRKAMFPVNGTPHTAVSDQAARVRQSRRFQRQSDQLHTGTACRAEKLVSKYRIGPLFTPPSVSKADGTLDTSSLPERSAGPNWPGGSSIPIPTSCMCIREAISRPSASFPHPTRNSRTWSTFKGLRALFPAQEGPWARLRSPRRTLRVANRF